MTIGARPNEWNVLVFGIHLASNRNEYQKQKYNVSGELSVVGA
jgi:hypothetical protein